MKTFDAIIIGTGQAGPALATRLTKQGMNVAIIERKLFHGTCVNTGCIPTKTMVASARVAHMARRAADFGIDIQGPVRVDFKKIMERKNDVVGHRNHETPQWMQEIPNLKVFKGHARFVDSRAVEVNGQRLHSDKIFINVGARAAIPEMPGLHTVDFMTNSDMMHLENLPEHLIIIGGSYIGLEFGQMFRRFGSKVTIVEMGSRLIGRDDEDISEAVKEILQKEGVNIRLNAECIGVRQAENGIAVNFDCKNELPEITGSHLLLAVGRVPNTHDLGLSKAGIGTDERGFIKVDDQLRTNIEGIWALGDCNGKGAFTHTSYNDYEIVAANLLDNEPRRVSDRILAYALYIDPPLGRVGMTESQVRKSGKPALMAKFPMDRVGRAKEKGETDGFMKVLVDAESKLILGAAVLGVGGDEIIHSLIDIMYAQKPYSVIERAMHIHPTVSELIPTMLHNLEPIK